MDLEKTNTREEARRSKLTVAFVVLLALIGVGVWAYLEFSADVLVDRSTAKRFGSRFEKSCQASYAPDVCRKIAGMNHQTCFEGCVKKVPGESGVVYDADAYLACMKKAQDNYSE